ncbi:sn-glycerol-3-phosphate ABC transporter ATP-binding protein UgpC [Rhodovibrio sodomensis]|uniref:Sn-glycerol-3-phosphate ABC transporter ATP-binding protein UgpC n=1 Tax=Rhodovibrio sodomensis TaxID=1088 RepID=A0ABS1DBD0_9PROT|nr:sn-glycerol-3-phosphate import ATP-binding protein UgpC [Rhodovibrio sodomensis]MBK1667264.1 sn-glycerol-3-phosphate ABC transporter ATP-binding protein UgpC [Rhodovibrio sodomensis]
MGAIGIRDVRKSFGRTQVIHGVDLDVADGEFIVVVGPSGCGKSTLLRMVAGLEEITEGEIAIAGRSVNKLEPKERGIAMVFQNYALYPHMSVYANMAYGLKIARKPKDEIDRRVREAARILAIEDYLERRPGQLSGGQRQRVAMGRAIVRDPSVFLFDEPLSNLDAKLRVQMRLEIKQLQRRLGTTSLYVTHDQVEAMTLADRLVVMNAGVAEQIDTPLEVYQRPATRFVAGFIGSPAMNFLDARIAEGGDLRLPELEDPLARHPGASNHAGRAVSLGVRPEHLRPPENGEAPGFQLSVDLVETLGADTLAHGRIDDTRHELTARLPGTHKVAEGERVPLTVDASALHLFDAQSGQRIAG